MIVFGWVFAPNFDPQNLTDQAPAAARARFIKKSLFAFCIDFSSMLVPTCLHFRSKNPPKSLQTSILEGINFLIDFGIDFLLIFARFWKPTWRHVGHIFLQDGATNLAPTVFLIGSMFFFIFWAVLTPSWRHLGSIWEGLGLDFGRFWPLFWRLLATIWAYDYCWKTSSFDPFCWRLVLDGLVGLREAQRIQFRQCKMAQISLKNA